MTHLTASVIILEYVCPGLGVIICQFMFSAPYKDLKHAIERGHIGDLNPTPWALMLGNCFGWVIYGILTDNLFIYWANAPGFCLSVYLNLGAAKLLYQRHHATEMRKSLVTYLQEQEEESKALNKRLSDVEAAPEEESTTFAAPHSKPFGKTTNSTSSTLPTNTTTTDWATIVWNVTSQTTPAPAPHETLVLSIVLMWTACMSLIGFADSFNANIRESIVGTLVNLNLVFFYGAPLSTIYTVLKQRNSSSIHIRTMVTNTLNGTFWCAYGFAIFDPFVFVPNGLGALLGAIQIALIVIFPRRPLLPSESMTEKKDTVETVQDGGDDH